MRKRIGRFIRVGCFCLFLSTLMAGCGTFGIFRPGGEAAVNTEPEWKAFDLDTKLALDWSSLVEALLSADVIVVGEQHDNAAGHELERRLTAALLDRYPDSAIAMEMFERNEQAFVDLYLQGQIQAETLVQITDSASWGGGKDTWRLWYQPIVDCVKEHHDRGAYLKAANCPRSFVKLARLEGFDVIDGLEGYQSDLVTVPDLDVNDLAYRDRFVGLMTGGAAQHGSKSSEGSGDHGASMSMNAEAYFRAQQTWDASMAASVLEAKAEHAKVMMFVGEFHMAFDGGLMRRIQYGSPDLKVATVSILRSREMQIRDEDRGRARFVVYTH